MSAALLIVSELSKRFGGLLAVNDVSFHVDSGEIMGLIGPNGAGKTTAVNVICGELAASEGCVIFDGIDMTDWPAHLRAQRGLVRTFQQVRLFARQTVRSNVEIGAYQQGRSGLVGAVVRSSQMRRDEITMRDAATDALELLGLADRAEVLAGELSTGEQRLVGVARALAARPKLLVLDEPAAGLNESETIQLQRSIKALRDSGITIIVVEHHMRFIMAVCDRICVLADGAVIAVNTPALVREDPNVLAAYLGGSL
jgi:branched-chain amino acid transport system ATP-binding protein